MLRTGWRRLHRRRPELAPWSRWPLFLAGVAIVVLGIVSPLDAIAEEYLQSAHMLQHVLIADLGVALALLAVRGPLSMFFLPRDLLAPLARMQPLRRTLTFLLRPPVAVALWLGVLVAWHLPFSTRPHCNTRSSIESSTSCSSSSAPSSGRS